MLHARAGGEQRVSPFVPVYQEEIDKNLYEGVGELPKLQNSHCDDSKRKSFERKPFAQRSGGNDNTSGILKMRS